MVLATCLASTGFSGLPLLLLSLVLIAGGALALRSAKLRASLMAIALVGGLLTLGAATARPAAAACSASFLPTAVTSTTTTAPSVSSTALSAGAAYLANEVNADGSVNSQGGASYGVTVQTLIALVASNDTSSPVEAAISRSASYLAANWNNYALLSPSTWAGLCVTDVPSVDTYSAMNLGYLLLAAVTTNNPALNALKTTFVADIEATQQTSSGSNPYYFGACVNQYAGVQSQSVVVDALLLNGMPASNSILTNAVTWLVAQQCSGVDAGVNGGFSSDIIDNPCTGVTPSTGNYVGPDTNSTGYALLALAAMGEPSSSAVPAAALGYLQNNETSPSGWGYYNGNAVDSNSTGVVISGLLAMGQRMSASTGIWAVGGVSPLATLATFQVIDAGANSGGFFYQAGSLPDPISTYVAVVALSGQAVPS